MTGWWKSPRESGDAEYPAAWKIMVPAHDLELVVKPFLADQEHGGKGGGIVYGEG